MTLRNKISVVVLGEGDSLKKALITNITGRDLSQLSPRKVLSQTEIYENETYEFICTPDLNTQYVDVREVLKNQHDMCLLVVEDRFSADEVWKQIEQLSKTTGKQTEEFIVVPTVRYSGPTEFPFRCFTFEQLIRELNKLAEKKRLIVTNRRPADNPETHMSTSQPPGGRYREEFFTDTKKGFQGKRAGTTVNLVLLGLTGTGKSASGNTILGKKLFESRISSNPITTECKEAETEIDGTRVRVIDTPDIFDDEIDSSVKDKHVTKCRQLCQSGHCVFLLVMHVSRFTDGERDILTKLQRAFGDKVHEQTVVLFTRGDDLKQGEMTLKDFLCSCQPDLKKVVGECGNRCVVFENRDSKSHQAKELMKTVNKMLEEQIQSMDQNQKLEAGGRRSLF